MRSIALFGLALLFVSFGYALEETLPKGAIQFKIQVRGLTADDYYNSQNIELPGSLENAVSEHEDQIGDLQFQFGWDSRITIIAGTSFRRRSLDSSNNSLTSSGFPGVYLGVRQRLTPFTGGNVRLMAETGVFLPAEADDEDLLPLESGGVDWIMIGSYNQDWYPTTGGFEMDIGYRFRNSGPEDEVFLDARLRLDLRRVAKAVISYHVTESLEDNQIEFPQTAYPMERGSRHIAIDLERPLSKRFTASVGYERVLDGRNTFKTSGFRVSVTWRR